MSWVYAGSPFAPRTCLEMMGLDFGAVRVPPILQRSWDALLAHISFKVACKQVRAC